MNVTTDSEYHFYYNNQNYYFCSQGCEGKFSTTPDKYLNLVAQQENNCVESSCSLVSTLFTCPMHPEVEQQGQGSCPKCGMALEAKGLPVVENKVEYSCPMHPEIVQDFPGNCPKCGMALESKVVAIEEKNEELIDMRRRFWASSVLAIPVFLLAMIADIAPALLPDVLSMQTVQWVEFILATPVVLWGGWPFYQRAVQSVITWNLNMFTLIGLGVSVAWIYSTVALLAPGIFPPVMQMEEGLVAVYFEACCSNYRVGFVRAGA